MEEQAAHELYTEFQAVDAGARFKQGLGFAGRGAPKELQGWADKDDDDVIARNRRLFGGGRGRQEERGSPEYDSDTAEAVQRRLRQLKKEQRPQQAEGAAPLPERLYDEQREQRQARHSQPERAAQEERRHHSDSLRPSDRRERRRSRSRERRRSRSRERRRSHSRDRRRSRSRSAERHRHHHGASDSRHRRRSRSRERERERDRHYRAQRRSRSPRSRDERRGEERGRASGRPDGGGGGGAPAVGSGLQKLDFEALIPGYSAMTAPQKLKAKTQYLLERSEAKDRKQQERGRQDEGGAEPQQWTRFKFSDAAELEEHRLQPAAVYGEPNEEAEDVAAAGLGGLSAVTFKQSNAAAVQQERDDSHAAAIFGGGGGGGSGMGAGAGAHGATAAAGAARPRQGAFAAAAAGRRQQRAPAEELRSLGGSSGTGAAGMAGSEEDLLALAEAEGAVVVPAAEVAAVLHQPQSVPAVGGGGSSGGALSWRERALAAKRAKQQQ